MSVSERIGLLGGSFNPPHVGHTEICRYVLGQNRIDKIWVIPCFEHPFGKALATFDHRFEMCRLAFAEFGGKVRVLDLEKQLQGKSYTLRTVQSLQKQYPDLSFRLILGEDVAKEAKSWHRGEELRKALPWLIVPRGEASPIPDVSASFVREALQKNDSLKGFMHDAVLGYIRRHHLYQP